jgi:hypothetical protein
LVIPSAGSPPLPLSFASVTKNEMKENLLTGPANHKMVVNSYKVLLRPMK